MSKVAELDISPGEQAIDADVVDEVPPDIHVVNPEEKQRLQKSIDMFPSSNSGSLGKTNLL